MAWPLLGWALGGRRRVEEAKVGPEQSGAAAEMCDATEDGRVQGGLVGGPCGIRQSKTA